MTSWGNDGQGSKMGEDLREVTICEVGPRDGLQNEARVLSIEQRVDLVERLSACGLPRVEAISFVNPRRVPQMSHAEEVLARIRRRPGTVYAGLVLNQRGAERALAAAVDEIHFAVIATETFNLRNQGATIAETVDQFRHVAMMARRESVRCTATIGAAFGCPFEGPVGPDRIITLADELASAGAEEIFLADTIGVAVPTQVTELIGGLRARLAHRIRIGCHFHNTRNTGLANAYAAIESGVRLLDASVGGVGGCPFAPQATGNIATEDLAYMLNGMGYRTNVDLVRLIDTAAWLELLLERPLPGMVMKAGIFPIAVLGTAASG
jgi:isopropylmalate/homocitrate/citramalate synthase